MPNKWIIINRKLSLRRNVIRLISNEINLIINSQKHVSTIFSKARGYLRYLFTINFIQNFTLIPVYKNRKLSLVLNVIINKKNIKLTYKLN